MTTFKAYPIAVTALVGVLAGASQAQTLATDIALPLHIGGRVVADGVAPTLYTHQWPGTYFESRFKGTSVTVRLNDSVNKLDISIDGKPVDMETKPGSGGIAFGPLADGEHTIRVEQRTESAYTTAQFIGFFVPEVADVLPAPQVAREIEFIGDSYTVGYGNTSPKRTCTADDIWATTDTQLAFGPLTAKHYGADYQINAISGRGIVRNYNGGAGEHLPEAYPFDLNLNGTKVSTPNPAWQPQIIVIGLGTNDFTTPLHAGEKWATREALHADYEATYVAFIQGLRAKNPGAYFILMATDQVDGEIQSEVKKVVAQVKATGETRVDFVPMNGLSFGGCDWHPTTADDQAVSQTLTAFIDAHPELWQGK